METIPHTHAEMMALCSCDIRAKTLAQTDLGVRPQLSPFLAMCSEQLILPLQACFLVCNMGQPHSPHGGSVHTG